MKKLVIIRKILKILYPELNVIVRYNKDKYFELIIKNIKKSYTDEHTFKVMLFIPGNNDLVLEDFVDSVFGYCSFLTEDNCVIKYLGKKGFISITKPI